MPHDAHQTSAVGASLCAQCHNPVLRDCGGKGYISTTLAEITRASVHMQLPRISSISSHLKSELPLQLLRRAQPPTTAFVTSSDGRTWGLFTRPALEMNSKMLLKNAADAASRLFLDSV
jgi:hypothetical protein